ncbi:putative HTH-type transcriptional regulator YurK [Corynebacterium faecale]|uniref:GntR family transcriptional regulator n=1 Tax=Corynebacterium faecale TaxID=1758466 RepID=UPI0025B29381|nr:GntR family transcriptional regulator [Corynebacterium faecale]WJY92943.1 putative HTH-type transcriptional regulator YurK [Corynebacterium faecale]
MSPSSGPAYSRIATAITARIDAKQFAPGDRLPAERELAQEFGVARMTVRQALDQLQMDGLIGRKRGRTGGSFVLGSRPILELTRIDGFRLQLSSRGHQTDSTVLLAEEIPASALVATRLQITEGDPVARIVRLLTVDATPILIEDSYFPAHSVPGMLDQDLGRSVHELLGEQWSLAPVRKKETIAPGVATPFEQQHLGVGTSLPLLRIHRVAEIAGGQIIEYSEDVLRSDAASIRVVTEF